MREAALHRMALAVAVLLASLSLVAWRQGRALGLLTELDAVQAEMGIARTQVGDLHRDINRLTSRARIVADAGARLGLHPPEGDQVRVVQLETER